MSPEDRLRKWTSAHGRRLCLHPNAGKTCRGGIVRAHALRRSADLGRIARDGHVYGLKPRLFTPPEDLARPQLIGVNVASTFTGFCQHHDAALFRPLEAAPFDASPEQVMLLSYRTLCRELYAKRAALEFIPAIREGDRGASPVFQAWAQASVSAHELGNSIGLRDVEVEKNRYDGFIRAGDYSAGRYLVIGFDGAPDFVFSSGFFPDASFGGEGLQNLGDLERKADAMTVSLITTETGAAAVLACLTPSPASERFARSLDGMVDEAIPHALVRFAFETESVYSSPAWWEGLDGAQQEALIQRTKESADPTSPAREDRYMDDGLGVVGWVVTSRTRYF